MENHDIFLKHEDGVLMWSKAKTGPYSALACDTLTFTANGGDTVTFEAVSGIDKIQKIEDGLQGTKKMIKSKKGEDSTQIVATIIDKTVHGEIDRYSITYKPMGGKSITLDPEGKGGGKP